MSDSSTRRARQSTEPTSYPHPRDPATTAVMRANRRVGTKPEALVRSLLHGRGMRFRKDFVIALPTGHTRPDVVFTRAKLAVYVDGCFWHSCPEHGTQPERNSWYWGPKLERVRERDARNVRALREAGWTVLRFWEHDRPDAVAEVVERSWRAAQAGPATR